MMFSLTVPLKLRGNGMRSCNFWNEHIFRAISRKFCKKPCVLRLSFKRERTCCLRTTAVRLNYRSVVIEKRRVDGEFYTTTAPPVLVPLNVRLKNHDDSLDPPRLRPIPEGEGVLRADGRRPRRAFPERGRPPGSESLRYSRPTVRPSKRQTPFRTPETPDHRHVPSDTAVRPRRRRETGSAQRQGLQADPGTGFHDDVPVQHRQAEQTLQEVGVVRDKGGLQARPRNGRERRRVRRSRDPDFVPGGLRYRRQRGRRLGDRFAV